MSDRSDYQCPRCREWFESNDMMPGQESRETCVTCGFQFIVEAFRGAQVYSTKCVPDAHLWETFFSGCLKMDVCARCGESRRHVEPIRKSAMKVLVMSVVSFGQSYTVDIDSINVLIFEGRPVKDQAGRVVGKLTAPVRTSRGIEAEFVPIEKGMAG